MDTLSETISPDSTAIKSAPNGANINGVDVNMVKKNELYGNTF